MIPQTRSSATDRAHPPGMLDRVEASQTRAAATTTTTHERALRWLRGRGGVAHSSDAKAAGLASRDLARLVADGDAKWVRRSWLVATGADAAQEAAASVGGRLTCVSAAKKLGLWAPAHDEVHVAVAVNASRFASEGLRLHWAAPPAPVARSAIIDPIVNVLFTVARCVPREDALAVWESAIRKGLAEANMLARVAWRSTAAAELGRIAGELSDSGLETRFASGLRRAGISLRQQVWIDGHPVDGLIGDALAVQLDGFAHHSSAADRRRDLAADARLVLLGYTVLRFDYQQVFFAWDEVLATVQLAIAQNLHRARRR